MGGKSLAGPAKSITKHMAGIISYGVYIPHLRIKTSEIAKFWGKDESVEKHLGVTEKAIAGVDEDTITMAVESAKKALASIPKPGDVGSVIVGSESHPYAVKPTSTIVGNLLGLSGEYLAADTEFACKAGSAALAFTLALVESKKVKLGLVIGADTAQAKLNDALEYTAGSAAVSLIVGTNNPVANILYFTYHSSDTPDFWRRDGQKFPSHSNRFSGEPAYFSHILSASKRLLKETQLTPKDLRYAVFHMPNGKFPKEAAKRLGFSWEQIAPGFVVDRIGNPYSASSLIGLAAVLDIAKPHEKIFFCSYGSGAGSDAFIFETTKNIVKYQIQHRHKVADELNHKQYIGYADLLKIMLAKKYIQ